MTYRELHRALLDWPQPIRTYKVYKHAIAHTLQVADGSFRALYAADALTGMGAAFIAKDGTVTIFSEIDRARRHGAK